LIDLVLTLNKQQAQKLAINQVTINLPELYYLEGY